MRTIARGQTVLLPPQALGVQPLALYITGRRVNVGRGTELFSHTSIRTSNIDRSISFYVSLLGLKLVNRREIPQNNAEIAFLQNPEGVGAILELTFYRKQQKFVQADYEERIFDHIAFDVRNLEKTVSQMRKEGVTITDEPFKLGPTGPLIAFIEDPDGTLIELIERK